MIILFGLTFVAFLGRGAQADWLQIFTTPENSNLQCYSCSSLNATEIIAGAGVDPGLFLSTIQLDAVPMTHKCKDKFDPNDALRTGITAERCDDGLCVKINYTDKYSPAQDRCFSCTTLDVNKLLVEVQDEEWRRWLTSIRGVPRTAMCEDPFDNSTALRAGAQTVPCAQGACMKMWFRETGTLTMEVWRSCIPEARGQVRTDCTKISSSQGEMEVCTCEGNLCNTANLQNFNYHLGLLSVALVIYHQIFSIFN